ncbi:MAG TPA: MarR family transcriptional regulator [Solirubrobacteraceae bacterium]|nr:MarR family transcriptional regulator [Solirubrobacteraceae bacterium]
MSSTAAKHTPNLDAPGRSSADTTRGSTTDANRFAQAWDEFLLALRRSQARGQTARDELTLAQYYALAQLRDQEALPVCQLAEGAGIAPPTATRLIDGLERAGLLQRTRSEADRRAVLVSLTEAGREALRRKQAQIGRRRRTIYERLEPEERRQSERLLHHLAEIMDQL